MNTAGFHHNHAIGRPQTCEYPIPTQPIALRQYCGFSPNTEITIYADWHTHARVRDPFSKPDKEGMLGMMDYMHRHGHPFMGCFYAKPTGDHILVTYDSEAYSYRFSFKEYLIGEDKEKSEEVVASLGY